MFPEGAELFNQALLPYVNWYGKQVFNIGSGLRVCYDGEQPYIHEMVLKPILDRGGLITNFDLKTETLDLPEGMTHVVADVSERIPADDHQADVVLCTSMVEHVREPQKMLREIERVTKPRGLMWFEAPADYPLHNEPIDTGLRLHNRAEVEAFLGEHWMVLRYLEFVSMSCPSVVEHGSGVVVLAVGGLW